MRPGEKLELARELTAFETKCKEVGEKIEAIAHELMLSTRRHILVDDVEEVWRQQWSLDSWRLQLFRDRAKAGAESAYDPDRVESEGDLVESAYRLLSSHPMGQKRSMRLSTETGEQRVKLRGFAAVKDAEHPSCDLLDVVWHERKADEAEILITVLHKKYKNQQARVHALARELSMPNLKESSSATLFLDDEGNPESLSVWKARDEVAERFFKAIEAKYQLT